MPKQQPPKHCIQNNKCESWIKIVLFFFSCFSFNIHLKRMIIQLYCVQYQSTLSICIICFHFYVCCLIIVTMYHVIPCSISILSLSQLTKLCAKIHENHNAKYYRPFFTTMNSTPHAPPPFRPFYLQKCFVFDVPSRVHHNRYVEK